MITILLVAAFLVAGYFVYERFFDKEAETANTKSDFNGGSMTGPNGQTLDSETIKQIQERAAASGNRNPLSSVMGNKTNDQGTTVTSNLQNLQLTYTVKKEDTGDYVELVGTLEADIRSILARSSGEVVSLNVGEGDPVTAGQELAKIDDKQYRVSYLQALNDYENSLNSGDRITELKKLQLELAEEDLANTTVISPSTGIISAVNVNVGDNGSGSMFEIVDTDSIRVSAAVDESDLKTLRNGMKVTLSFENQGIEAEGTLSYISPVAQTSGGIVLIPIEMTFDEKPEGAQLIPGTTCDVRLIVIALEDAMVIPAQGLQENPSTGGYFVWRKTETDQEQVPVTVGERTDDKVQILTGLNEGDIVLLKPDQAEMERLGLNQFSNPFSRNGQTTNGSVPTGAPRN